MLSSTGHHFGLAARVTAFLPRAILRYSLSGTPTSTGSKNIQARRPFDKKNEAPAFSNNLFPTTLNRETAI
jgi:hypothetical protein